MRYANTLLATALLLAVCCSVCFGETHLVYQGSSGPGVGKHIVFVAGDHEYRSEETLPALARILAKHHGFRCTVLFTVDQETGEIVPGNSNIPGLVNLQTADLMVNFLRFQDLPADQMRHVVDYLDRAGPVVGLRTSTHAFRIPEDSKFAKYSFRYKGTDYASGFGRQVLGETWAGHYGKNHVLSTRLDLVPEQKSHPILRGVRSAWVESGAYWAEPEPDCTILATAQPLNGMTPDSPPADDKESCPGVWVRTYPGSDKEGRVFTSLYGASEDLRDDGFRRMLINGCYWAMGMENAIEADMPIDFVGPFHPTTYRNGGHRQNVKPADLAGFASPIMPTDRPIAARKPRRKKTEAVSKDETAETPFVFKQDDVVAIYGNGLADRMQHDPWVETALQSQLRGKNVSFRNMSFSGDVVNKKPRSQGFFNDEEYLQHVAPSVVFIFYGYNESFGGAAEAATYETELVNLVERYRALRKEADVDARFVLFSPIAYENTGDPNLPDESELNTNLTAYTEATRRAAQQANTEFVDLFSPTLQLFDTTDERLTLNGIHLNAAGYQGLADVISQALLAKPAPPAGSLADVYAAVKDKNWHWHNRYRATDGNDIWGTRSVLTFVDGQSNADVLKHELMMLDVMTANRDRVIWAAAEGKTVVADDSNVPPAVTVKSNVGGLSKSSNLDKEGSLDYLSPEESLEKIKVPEGFELNVFASEVQFPDLANPVQLQVDAKGRLWAASWNSYPKWEPLNEMNDSLMIFEDTDRDGVADRRKIFAHVHNPLGFEFWGGGVFVTSGPDLLFLKDTDGDDVADVRYPVLQGLGTSDTHHAANNLIYGPDGGIYWQSGIFLVHNHETPWKQNLNIGESGMYRFDPRTFAITPIAANRPNPHGTSFDYWGYCYANDGTGGKSYQVRPEGAGFKMHVLLDKEFRPVPANEILSSEHFPEDMQDDFLICNVIGFLGVKQYDLDRDGDGKRRKFGEVWGTPVRDLLNGEDRNFRPSDAIVGEDGALYVADWHNMIIGHMQHNIRDPNRDHRHGRILRLTAKGRPLQKPVSIHGLPVEELLENLKHPVNGVRHRTRVELSGRDSKTVIAAAQKWMKDFDPNDETEAHHLLEALWLHQQHNVQNDELLETLLRSKVQHAAVAATTVRHFWERFDVKRASTFVAPAEVKYVRFKTPKHLSPEDQRVYKRGAEIFQRESHCATCHMTNGEGNGIVYPTLVGSPWVTGSEDRLVKLALHGMWGKLTVRGKTYDPARGVPPMTAFRDLLKDDELAAVLTFVRNTWGNQASTITPETVARVRAETSDRTVFWKPEDLIQLHPLEAELMAEGDSPAETIMNTELESALLNVSPTELAEIAVAEGSAARGKDLFYKSAAACFACHDPPAGTPRLGPDLTKVMTKMTPEALVDAVLRPSKQIDKEFAQVTVLTVEGKLTTGIRVSESDEQIVLRNLAQPKPITIAREDVEEVIDSKTSLMPEGLSRQLRDRQEFNDLMKYVIEVRRR